MRGRAGCPTGQEKNSVGATGGSPRFLLLQGKVGYRVAPSSAPVCALGHLPPKGKALGREEPSVADFRPSQGPEQNPICFLHGHKVNWPKAKRGWPGPCAGQKTLLTPRVPASLARFGVHPPILGAQRSGSQNSCLSQPAQPGGGPLRAWDTGPQARQKKKEDPRRVPPNQKRWVQGGRTSSSRVFFPPAFFQRKPGPRPGPGGQRGAAPRGLGKAPPTRRVRRTAPAGQGPHQTGALFFAQFCATFLPPPCTPACNFGPGSPGGERRFCHAHPP